MLVATRLFVGNLPDQTQETDLRSAFSDFGEITTLDLKTKPADGSEFKKFAFVSLATTNFNIESCINHFSSKAFNGNKLYVTRARESFLERLQRERQEAQQKQAEKNNPPENLPQKNPVLKLGDKLNPRKRKTDNADTKDFVKRTRDPINTRAKTSQNRESDFPAGDAGTSKISSSTTEADQKKLEAERKRAESMKKKRQEFKEKQMIIKTGLTGVDKIQNKKVIFNDDGDDDVPKNPATNEANKAQTRKSTLFDDNGPEDGESDNEVNFNVKKQFEGKKGQKVLDLQSRYKSDKRFNLDERFLEDEEGNKDAEEKDDEQVELGQADEKAKQLNILQDVLGVTIKSRAPETDGKKNKPKLGMLRFDPMQPEHAKFLAPVETKPEPTKKSKKNAKEKQEEIKETQDQPDGPTVEVSKEQFYKVSDSLKEAIAQPNTFSLRSLFGNNDNADEGPQKQDGEYIPLESKKEKKKIKNPLDPKEKNPFVYDSSDSETEEPEKEKEQVELPAITETKAVWKENLFLSDSDPRISEGLAFFNKPPDNEVQKERRELRSLVKKRINNKDRKNQMFKKKIGGKKKGVKKAFNKNKK